MFFRLGFAPISRLWIKVFVKALPNSSAVPPKTIFAFLMLNTPRSAHNKIFGAKFLSFERAAIVR